MVKDYSSIYDIKDFIVNGIAPNYFDIEDLSMMNTGWFGYTTEIASVTTEDTMRTTSRYITELIPGQSRLSEFIYAQAANYEVTDVFAHCAKCDAILLIAEEHILRDGKVNGRYIDYTIDADLVVYINEVPFSIPSDIKIRAYLYNGVYKYRCFYNDTLINGLVEDPSATYIKSIKTRIVDQYVEDTASYIGMYVTLYQYQRKRKTEYLLMNSRLGIPYVDVPFEDSLCNFEVVYTPANSTKRIQLKKYLTTSPPTATPFCYYRLDEENSLRISFANDDRFFIPEYNSQLEIYRYECLGAKGDFPVYGGENIYVSPSSEDIELDYNNKNAIYCRMVSDSIGSKNAPTLEEVRTLTRANQITVKSLTTDNDLDAHFSTVTTNYNTFAKFIKLRHDLVDRIYSSYCRIRDDDRIYPTNTINLGVDLDRLSKEYDPDSNSMSILAGCRIGYRNDSITDCYVMEENEEKADIEYTLIGLLSIEKDPTSAQIYMNSVDDNIPMAYAYTNDDTYYQFIVNSVKIHRNAIVGEMEYTITVQVSPTDYTMLDTAVNSASPDYNPDDIEEGFVPLDIAKIGVYLFFDESLGHYLKLEYEEEDSITTHYTFKGKIGTSDVIAEDMIELTGLTFVPSQEEQTSSIVMQNPNLKVLVFYDESTNPGHSYMDSIPAVATHTLSNIYEPLHDGMYFAYPFKLIRPTLEFVPSTESSWGYSLFLRDLPVMGRDFCMKKENLSKILKRLNSHHNLLQDAMITSNYAIYLKFFNTYGRSNVFTVTTGALLNRVNCDMDIGIRFVDGVEPSEYMDNIKLNIKEYVEKANTIDENDGVNTIKFSELMHELHANFPDIISYIVIYSINGYDGNVQTISMNVDLNAGENIYLVPEFLTINLEDIRVTIL